MMKNQVCITTVISSILQTSLDQFRVYKAVLYIGGYHDAYDKMISPALVGGEIRHSHIALDGESGVAMPEHCAKCAKMPKR